MDKSNHPRSSPAYEQFLRDVDLLRKFTAEHPITGELMFATHWITDAEKEGLKRLVKTFAKGYQPAEDSLLRLWGIRG